MRIVHQWQDEQVGTTVISDTAAISPGLEKLWSFLPHEDRIPVLEYFFDDVGDILLQEMEQALDRGDARPLSAEIGGEMMGQKLTRLVVCQAHHRDHIVDGAVQTYIKIERVLVLALPREIEEMKGQMQNPQIQ